MVINQANSFDLICPKLEISAAIKYDKGEWHFVCKQTLINDINNSVMCLSEIMSWLPF